MLQGRNRAFFESVGGPTKGRSNLFFNFYKFFAGFMVGNCCYLTGKDENLLHNFYLKEIDAPGTKSCLFRVCRWSYKGT